MSTVTTLPARNRPHYQPDERTVIGANDGDRHGWLNRMCGYWEAIEHGRHAQAHLTSDAQLPIRGAVITLPSWHWAKPKIHVGRKATPRSGNGTLLMPVRVTWQPSPVLVVSANTTVTATWFAVGLGHTSTGECTITVNTSGEAHINGSPPNLVHTHPVSGATIRRQLHALVEAEDVANWQALTALEPLVKKAVIRAVACVSGEINTYRDTEHGPGVLDPVSADQIADQLLLGDVNDPKPSATRRLLDRCLHPNQFRNVDPLRYITVSLARDAEQEVRRKIGDPRIGAKIRRVYRETGATSPQELIDTYTQQYPNDRLAIRRAERALVVGGDPMAGSVELTELDTRNHHAPDLFDELIERIDEERRRSA